MVGHAGTVKHRIFFNQRVCYFLPNDSSNIVITKVRERLSISAGSASSHLIDSITTSIPALLVATTI
jgi:hypothetical protein